MIFILTYWKQAVLGVLLCATLYYKAECNKYVTELATFKAEIATATAKQEADNLVKYISAQSKVTIADNQATFDMASLNLNRDKSSREMKALYENKINQLKHSMASRSGIMQSPSSDTMPTSETSSDTEAIAEGERIDHTATLEQACTIETLDYNLLRTWADNVCNIAVCE